MFQVDLHFLGDLISFVPRDLISENRLVRRILGEKTGVKDVIEACGVPHPEVDLILACAQGQSPQFVNFSWQVQAAVSLEVYPVASEAYPNGQRLQQRRATRFIADGHLGKLARNLRLLGLDTAYERDADDRRLLEIMKTEERVLLTRDRRLLMHSVVITGYSPRSSNALEQTREVLRRFSLEGHLKGLDHFQRCLRCNGLLKPVAKSEVRDALADEPLTLQYYDQFSRCTQCGKIYWPGTHFEKLKQRITALV